jgi:hypothetical protein
VCALYAVTKTASRLNLRPSAAMHLLHGNTAGVGQHRLIRSAAIEACGRRSRTAQNVNDLETSHHVIRDRAWACRAPCFAFDDFPFTVGDRDDQTC